MTKFLPLPAGCLRTCRNVSQVASIPSPGGAQGQAQCSRLISMELSFPCWQQRKIPGRWWGGGGGVLAEWNILPWTVGSDSGGIIEHLCLGPRWCSGAKSRCLGRRACGYYTETKQKWSEVRMSLKDVTAELETGSPAHAHFPKVEEWKRPTDPSGHLSTHTPAPVFMHVCFKLTLQLILQDPRHFLPTLSTKDYSKHN